MFNSLAWRGYPSHKNAVDMFKDGWLSRVPVPGATGGTLNLFETDTRPQWAADAVGGILGFDVLEIGPHEAHHTLALERLGAWPILSIECHTYSFLKCLVIKNIFGLRATFLLGDAFTYLDQSDKVFDLIFAAGVFYHLTDPGPALCSVCRHARHVFLSTHYFDWELISQNEAMRATFVSPDPVLVDVEGMGLRYDRRLYPADSYTSTGFAGGMQPESMWMDIQGIEALLAHMNFKLVARLPHPDHPAAPAISLLASRSDLTQPELQLVSPRP